MRVTLTCAALALTLLGERQAPPPVTAADTYAVLVHEYMSGHADEAVVRVAGIEGPDLIDRFKAFIASTQSVDQVSAAAAMETEAALRSRFDILVPLANRHLDIAAAIVETGMPPRMKRLGSLDFGKLELPVVSAQFRRLWFLTVIAVMENGGRTSDARAYLENARALFPQDPEFLLLSGICEEMRASNRLTVISESERRKALGYAEVYLRAALALAPDRIEARLRLGRVLSQRDHADEARGLLITVSEAQDVRLSYLASLFLGGLEDAAGHPASAAQWYARAAAKDPAAQAAVIAGSELQHRAGERHEAARSLAAGVGANRSDPWWAYVFGEFWRIDIYLNAVRRMTQS